jgi:hypothetical protein
MNEHHSIWPDSHVSFPDRLDSLECYWLGDIVRGVIWKAHRWLFSLKYPNTSLAFKYMERTSIPNNVNVLYEIVPTETTTCGLVVHLRLGDVIESHTRSVESFLRGDVVTKSTNFSMGHLKWKASITGASSEGFVKPAADYTDIIKKYDGVKNITLVGGTHGQESTVRSNNQGYL